MSWHTKEKNYLWYHSDIITVDIIVLTVKDTGTAFILRVVCVCAVLFVNDTTCHRVRGNIRMHGHSHRKFRVIMYNCAWISEPLIYACMLLKGMCILVFRHDGNNIGSSNSFFILLIIELIILGRDVKFINYIEPPLIILALAMQYALI